jgi:hypothetical protein
MELVDATIRRRVNILWTRWMGQKTRDVDSTGFKLWYSGSTGTTNTVGVLIDQNLKNRVVDLRRPRG